MAQMPEVTVRVEDVQVHKRRVVALEFLMPGFLLIGLSCLLHFLGRLGEWDGTFASALFWIGLALFLYSVLYAISENLAAYLDRACDGRGAGG
jgi:hypothetical protein